MLHVGQDEHGPGFGGVETAVRQVTVRVMIRVDSDADLFEVVPAFDAAAGLTHLLNRGQQQSDENGDDCDHHQQLDQRKPFAANHGDALVAGDDAQVWLNPNEPRLRKQLLSHLDNSRSYLPDSGFSTTS